MKSIMKWGKGLEFGAIYDPGRTTGEAQDPKTLILAQARTPFGGKMGRGRFAALDATGNWRNCP